MIRPLLFRAVAMVIAAWAVPAVAAPRCSLTTAMPGVHVPMGWDGAQPVPLVILLHGSTGTGAAILQSSGLASTADRHGFLVAYPDGGIPVKAGPAKTGFVWNIPGVPTVTGQIPGPEERDDVAYLKTLIAGLVKAGCADPSRVYVTGLSGGGRMASWLGCVAPERFAAIAPVVGLRAGNPLTADPSRPDPDSCRPDVPIPVIAFAGDKDTTNPIEGGGAGYWRYTMHAAEQRWAQLNGCRAAPVTRWITATVYEEAYGACRGDAGVIARITVGGGHGWVVDNEALWALLSRHRRRD